MFKTNSRWIQLDQPTISVEHELDPLSILTQDFTILVASWKTYKINTNRGSNTESRPSKTMSWAYFLVKDHNFNRTKISFGIENNTFGSHWGRINVLVVVLGKVQAGWTWQAKKLGLAGHFPKREYLPPFFPSSLHTITPIPNLIWKVRTTYL